MINLENGNIEISENVVIGRGLTKNEFIHSILANDILDEDEYGYTRYRIKPQSIGGKRFIIFLYFRPDGILSSITLKFCPGDEWFTQAWDDWSLEKMRRDKKGNDEWLKTTYNLQPWSEFPWGTVKSVFDERVGSSHILIDYSL